MTTDRAALVAAIEAEPDNDLPRLVWADWLDDHGDARDRKRAELIRLQCGPPSPAVAERVERVLDVLGRVWPADLMAGGLFSSADPYPNQQSLRSRFRRGCLTGLLFPSNSYLEHAKAFAGREPLLDVALTATLLVPPGLADSPHLSRVGSAQFGGFGSVLASPHFTRLHSVVCVPDEVAYLTGRRVRQLGVIGDGESPAGLARLLADTPAFAHLRHLGLSDCGFTAADYRTLIGSPYLSRTLMLSTSGRGHPRPSSAVFRDLARRFPGPDGEP